MLQWIPATDNSVDGRASPNEGYSGALTMRTEMERVHGTIVEHQSKVGHLCISLAALMTRPKYLINRAICIYIYTYIYIYVYIHMVSLYLKNIHENSFGFRLQIYRRNHPGYLRILSAFRSTNWRWRSSPNSSTSYRSRKPSATSRSSASCASAKFEIWSDVATERRRRRMEDEKRNWKTEDATATRKSTGRNWFR